MPKKVIGKVPFPPLVRIDEDGVIPVDEVERHVQARPRGVSFLVRSERGHARRGGYFFHVKQADAGAVTLHDFEGRGVATLSVPDFVELVNHCTGAAFSERMLAFSQNVVNLRLDPT